MEEAAKEHPELQAALDAWGLMEEEENGLFDIKDKFEEVCFMAKQYTREEVKARLQQQINAANPL